MQSNRKSEFPQTHEKKTYQTRMKTGITIVYDFTGIFVTGTKGIFEVKHHVELTYPPTHFNAVTCSNGHIFVTDSAPGGGVHIHSWNGQHTQSVSRGQLGLQDHDWIWAINHTPYDRILQLAVGDYNSETVHSLQAYIVSDFQAEIAFNT